MSMKAEFDTLINALGVPATLDQAVAPNQKINIPKIGFKTAAVTDPIVNSYGIGAFIVTFQLAGLGGYVPQKFDRLTIQGATIVLDAVVPIHDTGSGAVIGYKAYVRGKMP